jgi:hypothetical protein
LSFACFFWGAELAEGEDGAIQMGLTPPNPVVSVAMRQDRAPVLEYEAEEDGRHFIILNSQGGRTQPYTFTVFEIE